MARPVKVLLVSSHPVQYAAPAYRLYARDERLDPTVAFCSMAGAVPVSDLDFGVTVAWDVPLLDGYRWVHPANLAPSFVKGTFLGLVNPGLWRLVRHGAYDVVICFGYARLSFWIAALAAKRAGARLIFTTDAHSLAAMDGRRWKAVVKRFALPRVFAFADAALVPSSKSTAFVRELGVLPDRIFLTGYVVDNDRFAASAAAADRAAVRRRWNVPEGAFVALFSGKLAPWKRPQDLLAAAAGIEGMYVVFAGDGSLRLSVDERARELRMTDRVRHLGFVNQRALPEAYVAADVLVLPSEYEAFGVVVNEAFACGCPAIISNRCGSAGDLVRDGETGFVYPCGDVPALAEHLRCLASNRALLERLGVNARRRIGEWGPRQNAEAFARACLAVSQLAANCQATDQ